MADITKLLSNSKRGIKIEDSHDYIDASRKGLTMSQLRDISAFTGITLKDLSSLLSISERQLSRYDDRLVN